MFTDLTIIDLVFAAAVFGLVLSLWIGVLLLWSSRRDARMKRLERRLGLADHKADRGRRVLHLWHEGRAATTTVPGTSKRPPFLTRFDETCRRTGWSLGGDVVLTLVAGGTILGIAGTYLLTSNLVLAGGVCLGLLVTFRLYLRMRLSRAEALFERQFIDALGLAARSLRAGHPLIASLQLVSEEMPAPVSQVFGEICQQHSMGSDLESVLRSAARRTTSSDLKLFSTSVAIQIRSGGNLANLMDRLADVIRERIRLSRRVRVLTAQTQMSKRILIVLPFVVFFFFTFLNPEYMDPFYTTSAGRLMLGISLGLLAFGTWIINRMAVLKY